MGFYVDESALKNGVDFGLNQGLELMSFKGVEGNNGWQLNIKIGQNGRMISQNWYSPNDRPIEEVTLPDKTKTTDTVTYASLFEEAYKKRANKFGATLVHLLHAITTDDVTRQVLSPDSFEEVCRNINQLPVQTQIDSGSYKVDVFLQYPWDKNKEYTGLGLPNNRGSGGFLVKAQPGTFNVVTESDGAIHYVNENGVQHPFKRNDWFMSTELAKPSDIADNTSAQGKSDWVVAS